jgi:ribonuclease HI
MGKKFYGVKTMQGKEYIFTSWDECKEFTNGKSNILFKGFDNYHDLQEWFKNKKTRHVLDIEVNPDIVRIYVDGSYNSKTKRAGWGWVAIRKDQIIDFRHGECEYEAKSRQIDGELKAALEAMLAFPGEEIVIVHDYAGISNFASGDWTPRTKISVDYVNCIKNFVDLSKIIFQKIQGHSGNVFNDMADSLAKRGCGINE